VDAQGVAHVDYVAFVERAQLVLDAVDKALARLDDGTYGTCSICAEPITDELLERDPSAAHCERHLPLAESA
jgi:RNA polymerase-binding transcription factor DksA